MRYGVQEVLATQCILRLKKMKRLKTFKWVTDLDHSPSLVHEYHMRPGAFERLLTPWEHVRLVNKDPFLKEGAVNEFKVRLAPFVWKTWLAEHRNVEPDKGFVDDCSSGEHYITSSCTRNYIGGILLLEGTLDLVSS